MKTFLKFSLPIVALCLWLLGNESCRPTDKGDDIPDVKVNPEFEEAPPIARDIQIQVLEKPVQGKNVRFTASFPKEVIGEPFHALMLGEEKIVLRDDGKGGDEQAGDGIFTVLLNENLNALTEEMTKQVRNAQSLIGQKQMLLRFSGRTAEAIQLDERLLSLIRGEKLIPGVRIPFDIFGGGSLTPADPLLKEHSLMITDLSVVEDPTRTFNPCNGTGNPNGVWTFGHLMKEMANGQLTTEDFTRNWLAEWLSTVTVNGDPIAARTGLLNSVIAPWIRRSGGTDPITLGNWQTKPLDVTQAPFKLTAIVNRMDLGGNSGYGISNAGEGRFVFCVVRCNALGTSTAEPFNIIFEYGLPLKTCTALKNYAKEWIDLKTMTIGSTAYNAALETITAVFANAGANPAGVNGSAINQVRTNEISLGSPWELREFTLSPASKSLQSATVKQEPARMYNRVSNPGNIAEHALLASWVNANQPAVEAATHVVPDNLGITQPFLGGKAHTVTPGHFWDAAAAPGPNHIVSDAARHMFSLTTCSGCHGGEANTSLGGFVGSVPSSVHSPFVHIGFVPFGQKATLSGFLIGDPSQTDDLFRVNDPTGRGGPRGFNDLEQRARRLETIAARSCRFIDVRSIELAAVLRHRPIARMEH